jgi:ACS family hexuronate transporter-like MFS transporter
MGQTTEITYRYRWVILGVLWITYIVVFLHRLSVGPLAPFLKEDLSLTSAQVGLVMSAAAFGYTLTLFPIGWVVDRIGARWPMAIGELIAGISMIALFFTPSYIWLLILMFATGMGCGFLSPSTTQGVIVWFPLRERATVMGLKQTAVNIGGIITALSLPAVALALGWRYGFLFLGIAAIVIGAIVLTLYKEPPRPALSSSTGSTPPAMAMPLLELLKSREIWLVACCGLCLTWVEMTMIAHLVLYLTEVLLFSVVAAGGLLAMTEAAGAIARPGSGLLSDRVFGGKRKPVFILMAGTASVMCLLLGLFGSCLSWALYPVLLILGLGGIGFGGIYLTLMSEFGGRYGAGKAAGLGSTVSMGGSIFGPPVFGYIVDISGSYELAWLSLAFMAAVCILLLLFVREGKRKI